MRAFKPLIYILISIFTLMGASISFPAAQPPDKVKIFNKSVYSKKRKGLVRFTHKKHVEKYGATCKQCHHNEKYDRKVNSWKQGDPVQSCRACHKLEGAPRMYKLQKAYHRQCKDCHKKQGKGPYKRCNDCHADLSDK